MRAAGKLLMLALVGASGCGRVERQVSVTSNPPDALVWANDQEIGRTPFTRDFTWYGTYDVVVRKEGFQPLHTQSKVIAPWWQWPPIDLIVEILPGNWKDQRELHYELAAASTQPADPDVMLSHAEQLRIRLQGSAHTKNPAKASAKHPATAATTQPASSQAAE
jgi:hypothetical protein